jgi:sulfate transport system permease protein
MPLAVVFNEALRKGWEACIAAIVEPDAWSAIRLTLLAAAIAVPLNTLFGVAAAWAIAKFDFRGKNLLVTLIDLPFSVSPVVPASSTCSCSARRAGSALAAGERRRISSRCPASCCDDVRHLPVRRARADPAHAGAGRDEEEAAAVLGAAAGRRSGA